MQTQVLVSQICSACNKPLDKKNHDIIQMYMCWKKLDQQNE